MNPDPLTAYLATHDAPCPGCGYNLRGIQQPQCPECGRRVQRAELGFRKPHPMLVWLDTLWIAVLFALALVACFSMIQLVFLSRPHHFETILLNAIMGAVGGIVPLRLRSHGRAWIETTHAFWRENALPLCLTSVAVVSRLLALFVLGI